MCEMPRSVDHILTQLSAIPGCVEYTSLLDSFVENGTFANISNDREDQTSLCEIAGPKEYNNWKGGACTLTTARPKRTSVPVLDGMVRVVSSAST